MIYFYISLSGATTVLLYISVGYYASLQASRSLFASLLQRLTRAPARFFDVTPIGRILNRFSTDINVVDGALQNSVRAALSGVLNFVASFCVIIAIVPSFAPFAVIIAWLYIRLAPSYINASRDLRRLESVSLSPAFAGFDELLRGLVHVRAFGMESRYQDGFYKKVDKFQSFDHAYVSFHSLLLKIVVDDRLVARCQLASLEIRLCVVLTLMVVLLTKGSKALVRLLCS
jgi:ABC-type multidrug transport system fused ATPase/permease subunit